MEKKSMDGEFSISSAYDTCCNRNSAPIWGGWNVLWRLNEPQMICVFLWLVVHDRILTNYARWRRRIAESSGCGICKDVFEDSLHVLRDCPEARLVWLHLGPPTFTQKILHA